MEDEASSAPAYWAVVKGAPEVVQGFLMAPVEQYEEAYKEYAAQGGRCAHLPYADHLDPRFPLLLKG